MKYLMLITIFCSGSFAYANDIFDTVAGKKGTGFYGVTLGDSELEYDDYTMSDLPEKFDVRELISIPDVRDQGQCGSCWAFGPMRALEISIAMLEKKSVNLSEQEMVSCEKSAYGCQGGFMESAKYLLGGITDENTWPYVAQKKRCRVTTKYARAAKMKLLGQPGQRPTVDNIKTAIYSYGSVFVTVRAGGQGWSGNSHEITGRGCATGTTNHIVTLIGWTADGKWIMSNSWGPKWANNGYALMTFGCANIGAEAGYIEASSL